MATYDMTSGNTVGVGADSAAVLPGRFDSDSVRKIEAYLDYSNIYATGDYTQVNGDVFQLLEIPAGCYVLDVAAEVHTAFDGTSPTVDIDFAAGDDMIDGGDVSATGWLAEGTNGFSRSVNDVAATYAAATWNGWVGTTDTIDVKLIASSADCTVGVLRVVAIVMDYNEKANTVPTVATRDQLA